MLEFVFWERNKEFTLSEAERPIAGVLKHEMPASRTYPEQPRSKQSELVACGQCSAQQLFIKTICSPPLVLLVVSCPSHVDSLFMQPQYVKVDPDK